VQLAAEFAVRFEAPHVINARTQVWAGAIGTGPDRQSLSATFEQSKRSVFQACLHLH
jgi:Fanconi anemia group J protein